MIEHPRAPGPPTRPASPPFTSPPGAAPMPASCPTRAHPALAAAAGRRTTSTSIADRACRASSPRRTGRSSASSPPDRARSKLAEGEIETLYVLDDWRERGLGRALMQRAAARLAEAGCRSVFVWVLRDNPSKWFYQRLGGRPAAESQVMVGGVPMPQTAYVWEPIELLLPAPAKS